MNVRSLIGKSRDRHTHPSGADKPSNKNEEICLVAWEVLPNRLSYRNKEDTRYCVADERGDDLHQIVAGKVNAQRRKQLTSTTVVSTTITPNSERPSTSRRMRISILSNRPLDVTPFPSAIPPIARKTTDHRNCSKSSCGQRKSISMRAGKLREIHPYFLQDTCSKKCDNRNDRNYAHVTDPLLDTVFEDPESDRDNAYERYPPLLHSEAFARRTNALDLEITSTSHGQA